MKIIELVSQNVKRLKAITIKPTEDMVIIGGNNGQGKTSALDSIMYALGGKPNIDKPVRDGELKAKIKIDLEEYIVTRTISSNGKSTLTVSNKDGAKYGSPQKILDNITGKLCFDPLEFMRKKPAEQKKDLMELLGLDFSEIDKTRQQYYDDRTISNRVLVQKKAEYESIEQTDDCLPENEIVVSELIEELNVINEENKTLETQKNLLKDLQNKNMQRCKETLRMKDEIKSLYGKIEFIKNEICEIELQEKQTEEKIKKNEFLFKQEPKPTEQIMEKIKNAELINSEIKQRDKSILLVKQIDKLKEELEILTDKIKECDNRKSRLIEQAKFPLDGLTFGDDGLLYNNIPLSQCSASEQLIVSSKIGMALNPKLKVMIIRDASLLDDKSLKLLNETIKNNEFQLWIERVGKNDESAIIIEDGEII